MNMKKIVLGCVIVVCVAGGCFVGLKNFQSDSDVNNINENVKKDKTSDVKKTDNKKLKQTKTSISDNKVSVEKENKFLKKADLFDNTPSSALPLSAIAELANLPENIRHLVMNIAENNNIFMMKKYHDKLFVITDNPENIRHSVEFTEISLINGHKKNTTLGYNDRISDSDNDNWEYTDDTKQPLRHTKYNKDGDVEFVETWSYDPNESIKYEMKDAEGNIISLRKETLNGGTDLRVEHLIYDKDGNTRINVSATYDGEDVKRFTYYNADKPKLSGSVFSEYTDGLKTKETIYTSDLKVSETYTSEYKDGSREEIVKWDNKNQEVEKLVPQE